MKQENLRLLLRLISNYVEKSEMTVFEIMDFLRTVANYPNLKLSDEDKSNMYDTTVAALNDGSEEAERAAFEIRLKALCSGDDNLIENIEYLHEVI
jgi:hypothetical protein